MNLNGVIDFIESQDDDAFALTSCEISFEDDLCLGRGSFQEILETMKTQYRNIAWTKISSIVWSIWITSKAGLRSWKAFQEPQPAHGHRALRPPTADTTRSGRTKQRASPNPCKHSTAAPHATATTTAPSSACAPQDGPHSLIMGMSYMKTFEHKLQECVIDRRRCQTGQLIKMSIPQLANNKQTQ
ncbi:hypothetical protein CAPTEDRAFT_213151 [Capitella teleta]|uniref:Uncharacterized protein n=1 Tax=Capitella teleta TaxID=283909 RepID=R7TUX9_CAPTE|nr:hypothetical protein CAPTEDRAFT_213151 [Capitella teleta]|eukprot:ELT97524.1 hypothetical protein CAPTEDRAFT_213151 [Capitella teleta]